jgi:hypothetical protein
MSRRDELAELEEARAAWFAAYREPRDLPCPACQAILGTLFYITWAEQPLMDALADGGLGGVPTQGFYVLVSQEAGPLVPLQGRRRYARGKPPAEPLPPAWVGLPGEVTCAACGTLAHIPHPRFPQQARLDALQRAAGKEPRRRWRRG